MKKRVEIPAKQPAKLIKLATNVQVKHVADGDTSPLKPLAWQELNPVIEEAVILHDDVERYKRLMRRAFEQRALKMKTLTKMVRNSRDILAGANSDQMKDLGLWGFDVLDSKTSKTEEPVVEVKQATAADHSG